MRLRCNGMRRVIAARRSTRLSIARIGLTHTRAGRRLCRTTSGSRSRCRAPALRRRTATPVACEPRHDSWFQAPADALLRRYGIARVAADPVRHPAGAVPGGDTGWSYWRWHGSPRIYYSEYDEATLKDLAEAVVERAGSARPARVMLDNTAHGFAVPNALRLQSLFNWP